MLSWKPALIFNSEFQNSDYFKPSTIFYIKSTIHLNSVRKIFWYDLVPLSSVLKSNLHFIFEFWSIWAVSCGIFDEKNWVGHGHSHGKYSILLFLSLNLKCFSYDTTIYMESAHLIWFWFLEKNRLREKSKCEHLNRRHLCETWLDWEESICLLITCLVIFTVTDCAIFFSITPCYIMRRLFMVVCCVLCIPPASETIPRDGFDFA